MTVDDDEPLGLTGATPKHPFAHLIPARAMAAEEQAAITRREDARRKGRGRKDWHLRCPMKTDGWERPK